MTWKTISDWLDSMWVAGALAIAAVAGYAWSNDEKTKEWLILVAAVGFSMHVGSMIAVVVGDSIARLWRKRKDG